MLTQLFVCMRFDTYCLFSYCIMSFLVVFPLRFDLIVSCQHGLYYIHWKVIDQSVNHLFQCVTILTGYMVMLVTSFLPVSFVCGLPLAECCNVNVKHPVVSGDWHRCCDSNGETSILHWKVLTFPPACRYIYGWFISTVHCYLCRYWIFNIDLLHIHAVYIYTLMFTVQWEINTWGQVKVSCVSLQSTMLNLTVTSIYIENRWVQVLQSVT